MCSPADNSSIPAEGGTASEQRLAQAALRERVRQAELAAEVGRALTDPTPLPQQLQRCAEALVRHLDAAFARIWTRNEADPGMLVLQASAGCYTHLDGPHARIPVGQFKIGRIAAERRPHLTNTVPDDPQIQDPAWARREGMVAFAGHPLLVGERLVGVMGLFARQALSPATLQALGAVADTVALGIDRSRAEAAREALLAREQAARAQAEKTAATLATINRVGQLLSAELDQDRLMQAVTDAATELTGADFGAFFYNVTDERGDHYGLYTLAGAPREAFARFPLPRSTAIFGPTFRGEAVVRLHDVREDPRYGQYPPYRGLPPGHLPVVSYLAVPVVARSGEVLGGLFFGHPRPGVFDARAEALAVGLAAHAAVAVENARLYEQAQAAEGRYRALFGAVADAILVADADRHYRDANAAAVALLGYTREELLRLRVEDVVAAEPDWTEAEYARFVDEGRWQGELTLRRKNGTTVPVEAWATVVDLAGGPVYLSAVRDITERKRAEAERRAFLDAAAHDLKNPLGVIDGQAQLLHRRLQRGAEPARLAAGLAEIQAAVGRTTAVLEQLQDVAYLRAGQPLELRLGSTDLVALARAAVESYRATTQRHAVRLETAVEALVGSWDATRLERVVDNLLANAMRYSPDGGEIVVRVMREEDRAGSWAVLAVRDEGLGIPSADLPHVFDRFRRGGNVAGRIAGSGIGLAGARQIVEQHGGTISVESAEGEGSTFVVRLPLEN